MSRQRSNSRSAAADVGYEEITTSRLDRRVLRLALKRYAEDLEREQVRNRKLGAANPGLDTILERIRGKGSQEGLAKRLIVTEDDLEDPSDENPLQLDWTRGGTPVDVASGRRDAEVRS